MSSAAGPGSRAWRSCPCAPTAPSGAVPRARPRQSRRRRRRRTRSTRAVAVPTTMGTAATQGLAHADTKPPSAPCLERATTGQWARTARRRQPGARAAVELEPHEEELGLLGRGRLERERHAAQRTHQLEGPARGVLGACPTAHPLSLRTPLETQRCGCAKGGTHTTSARRIRTCADMLDRPQRFHDVVAARPPIPDETVRELSHASTAAFQHTLNNRPRLWTAEPPYDRAPARGPTWRVPHGPARTCTVMGRRASSSASLNVYS